MLNNLGVVAEVVCVVDIIGALLFVKHPTQPLHSSAIPGARPQGHWLTPFMFAMILPAYVISSFDATGNASEETKDAAKKAPMASVLANVSSYIVGVILIGLLMLAIQDLPAIMNSALPVKDILATSVGSAFANVIEAVAMLAFFACQVMVQLKGFGSYGRRPATVRSQPRAGCVRSAASGSRSTPP